MATSGSDASPATTEARPAGIGPISAQDVETLVAASARLASVRRAELLATINGWSFAASAVITLGLGLLQWTLIPLGLALLVITRVELTSRSLLRVPDAKGVDRLVLNQIALFVIVAAYCGWRLWTGLHEPPLSATPMFQPYFQRMDPDVPQMLDRYQRIARYTVYGSLFAFSALYQSASAVFYYAQRRAIRRFVYETPEWARELLRVMGVAR